MKGTFVQTPNSSMKRNAVGEQRSPQQWSWGGEMQIWTKARRGCSCGQLSQTVWWDKKETKFLDCKDDIPKKVAGFSNADIELIKVIFYVELMGNGNRVAILYILKTKKTRKEVTSRQVMCLLRGLVLDTTVQGESIEFLPEISTFIAISFSTPLFRVNLQRIPISLCSLFFKAASR